MSSTAPTHWNANLWIGLSPQSPIASYQLPSQTCRPTPRTYTPTVTPPFPRASPLINVTPSPQPHPSPLINITPSPPPHTSLLGTQIGELFAHASKPSPITEEYQQIVRNFRIRALFSGQIIQIHTCHWHDPKNGGTITCLPRINAARQFGELLSARASSTLPCCYCWNRKGHGEGFGQIQVHSDLPSGRKLLTAVVVVMRRRALRIPAGSHVCLLHLSAREEYPRQGQNGGVALLAKTPVEVS